MDRQSFKDSAGRVWSLRLTIGNVDELKAFGVNVDEILSPGKSAILSIALDPGEIIPAIVHITETQRQERGLGRADLLEAIDGHILEAALAALLYAIAAVMPPKKRKALEALVPKMFSILDRATNLI